MENLKIVCLIQNDNTRTDKGLISAFGQDSESELNQFTKEKLYYFDNEGNFITQFGRGENKPKFVFISKSEGRIKPSIVDDNWEIAFVSDDFANSINDFPEILFDENTLLMYHTTPSIEGSSINKIQVNGKTKFLKKGKKGEHTYQQNEGFARLYKITEAWKETDKPGKYTFDKADYEAAKKNIIDWFNLKAKLNATLEFLHKSLGGTPASTDILTSNDDPFDFEKEVNGKTLPKWIVGLIGKTGVEYNQALANVRDALFKEAGITGEN